MSFAQLGLCTPLVDAVASLGYTEPTPIQLAAIPFAVAGQDILGCAQTGTGKTAGFSLPILHRLQAGRPSRAVRALILAPTRELAGQISDNIIAYGKHLPLRCSTVIGGVNIRPQEAMLRRGVDILVATPGRLLDHMQLGNVRFDSLEVLVLDEADRMLDMGFIRDIRKIMSALPRQRQTMLFSATLPPEIKRLADEILHSPKLVQVSPPATASALVEQVVHPVGTLDKRPILLELLRTEQMEQVIVFTRTKWDANKLTLHLQKHGHDAAAIHGNKSQAQRRIALERFKSGALQILVATDIASRGIDVKDVSHVINYDISNIPEDYVHRIGRTGRAAATGKAISLMSHAEVGYVRNIERLTGKTIPKRNLDGSEAAMPAAMRGGGAPPSGARRPSSSNSGRVRYQRPRA